MSGYDDAALDAWAARVRALARRRPDVFVYFDNDVKVRAPFDAHAARRPAGGLTSEEWVYAACS